MDRQLRVLPAAEKYRKSITNINAIPRADLAGGDPTCQGDDSLNTPNAVVRETGMFKLRAPPLYT